jgi:transposase
MTDHLKMLIEESSLPLAAVEQDFAVDSSGFTSSRYRSWFETKYVNEPTKVEGHDWLKAHIMCGVKTNIVTSVSVTHRNANDSPQFIPLVEATAENFYIAEVSADKAYSSSKNIDAVLSRHAFPLIAFRANATKTGRKQSEGWRRMYHYFEFKREWFMEHYHKRSNVETTFHMIKSKFGTTLRSKTSRAQVNDTLCKILCHNICCLIQAMFELEIKPEFWQEVALAS